MATTTATKELEQQGRRRQELQDEIERLSEEGARRQKENQPVAPLVERLAAANSELKSLNHAYKATRRQVAGSRVSELVGDAEFQKVIAVLAPLAELGRVVRSRRGAGFAVPSLPPVLERLAAEAAGYLAELKRRGGVA